MSDYTSRVLAGLTARNQHEKEFLQAATEMLDTVSIKPKKADIAVDLVALAWAPHWVDETGIATPAW